MWESCQFIILLFLSISVALYNSSNLPKFAMYSELLWLSIYVGVALLGSVIDSFELLSSPFIILVLTAVEAVIIWTLVVYSTI